jgi:hypothetical protein
MGRGGQEENLRFAMDFIKESHGSKRPLMPEITIRNGSKTLIGNFCSAIRMLCVPVKAGHPPPKGSSFGSRWLP